MTAGQQSFNKVFKRKNSSYSTTSSCSSSSSTSSSSKSSYATSSSKQIAVDSPVHKNKTVIKTSSPSIIKKATTSSSPIITLSPHSEMPTARFLRSFSEGPTQYSPHFSSISSSNSSYFSSSSYVNSITLPAAPVFSGSSFSSIKKKKRSLLRASIASSCSNLFQIPDNSSNTSDKMMMITSSNSLNESSNANIKANNRKSTSSDIELATEIGQGLLSEVRRMQSILQERQETLIQLEHKKADNQQRITDLIKQLRFKNETEEQLKEEIWNLELTKQDLSHQIRQLSASIHKTHIEQIRRERQENLVHQELELLKTAQLEWQETMIKVQNDYETKLATLHKSLLKLKREKDAVSLQLEQLQKKTAANLTKEETTTRLQRKSSEIELKALQVSLDHAHSVMESLQLDLENEKLKKLEVENLLRESQETIEHMQQQKAITGSDAADATAATSLWCQQDGTLDNASVHINVTPVSSASSLKEELLNVERR